MTTATDFKYTDTKEVFGSQAVDVVYYNKSTQELVVGLLSGETYLYADVPSRIFDEFNTPGVSAGRLYATVVKRSYGPGTYLGYDPEFDKASVPAADMGTVGTPKDLRYAVGAVVGNSSGSSLRFDLAQKPAPVEPAKYPHAVTFTVEDNEDRKTYNVDAVNVDAAVEALAEVSYALGVNVDVKSVLVSFE